MSKLEVKKYPDTVLRKSCTAVAQITKREKEIFDRMLFTMKYFDGVGLAAPQIGLLDKLIVVEFEGNKMQLANPEILSVAGEDLMLEGCLSVPDIEVAIKRPTEIVVKAMDENSKVKEVKIQGILARILLHEIDHLNGRLIVDYMPFWKKFRFEMKKKRKKDADIRLFL